MNIIIKQNDLKGLNEGHPSMAIIRRLIQSSECCPVYCMTR